MSSYFNFFISAAGSPCSTLLRRSRKRFSATIRDPDLVLSGCGLPFYVPVADVKESASFLFEDDPPRLLPRKPRGQRRRPHRRPRVYYHQSVTLDLRQQRGNISVFDYD